MCRIDIREASIRDVTFVLTAIILVVAIFIIYVKRHIERMRFQISTVSGVPYMQGVKKAMINEIEECLSIVAAIRKEPQLLLGRPVDLTGSGGVLSGGSGGGVGGAGAGNNNSSNSNNNNSSSDIVARMKTIDAMKQLDAALAQVAPSLKRRPFADVRRHLCDGRLTSGALRLVSLDVINDFVSLYEHARFDPGHYGNDKLEEFNELLKQLLYSINSHAGNLPTQATGGGGGSSAVIGSSAAAAASSSSKSATTASHHHRASSGAGVAAGSAHLLAPEERLLPMSSAVRRPLLADPGS